MAQEAKAIDISDSPDILQLADEVRRSGLPHVLRDGTHDLAILTPIGAPTGTRRTSSRRDTGRPSEAELARSRAGIRESAGSWKDVDAEAMKAYVRERRTASTRPPVEL